MILLTLNQFPTHLPYTKNKTKANKLVKLNYQNVYNGKVAKWARAILIDNIHTYIATEVLLQKVKAIKITKPITIKYTIHTVINHGAIALRKGVITCPEYKKNYKPNWDVENLANLWIKAGNDTLVLGGIIPDDTVEYIKGISYEFVKVSNLDDRKIVISYE
jgi:hypothetical protein